MIDAHEHDRDIPAGKVLTCECRDMADDARRPGATVLDTARTGTGTDLELVAVTAGWAVAGSMMRWDNGWYGVRFEAFNARHSRRFKGLGEARAAFTAMASR